MNEMLDFVKAMSDPDRLRIVGLLSQKSASRKEIAEQLNLSPKDSLTHLGFLEFIGVVHQTDGVFTLNEDKLATVGKERFFAENKGFIPPEELDEFSKKILRTYLNEDGSIRQIPESKKIQPILKYLAGQFEFDKNYTEREVNTIIKRFHEDTAGLRRDLIEAGLLARESDGSKYWKVQNGN
ncbi:MAG: DUF2087 domain-containing protein [Anaerolineales bacterium]|nr:DUF2087 domain-containing protein [Anaerolineales bacterium]MCB9146168.1 DUF2087 domain-containing protein [Anaerolineales bacterium]